MIEKKSSKGNLEKRRRTFLLIGLIVVLGLIYAAFELYASANEPKDLGVLPSVEVPNWVEVPPTDPTTQPPPPEPPKDFSFVIKDDDPIMKVDLGDIFGQDYPEGFVIGDYTPIPLPDEGNDPPPPVVDFPEILPEPIGGYDAMYAFLRSNLVYPEVPLKNFIQGQVFVQFVVERDGSISNVHVIIGVHPDLDKEAVRVVKIMPKWNPGKVKGKPVRSYYRIPIHFKIN